MAENTAVSRHCRVIEVPCGPGRGERREWFCGPREEVEARYLRLCESEPQSDGALVLLDEEGAVVYAAS